MNNEIRVSQLTRIRANYNRCLFFIILNGDTSRPRCNSICFKQLIKMCHLSIVKITNNRKENNVISDTMLREICALRNYFRLLSI